MLLVRFEVNHRAGEKVWRPVLQPVEGGVFAEGDTIRVSHTFVNTLQREVLVTETRVTELISGHFEVAEVAPILLMPHDSLKLTFSLDLT